MVLNSSTGMNLQSRITKLLNVSHVKDEVALLYASDNKVKAMEDCITFAPELFRLSKSIVVSEPVVPFLDFIRGNLMQ